MCKILIFGGTTEGRQLAEYCSANRIHAEIRVVSAYGEEVLPESPYLHPVCGALEEAEMEQLFSDGAYELVVDATHPYATRVSASLREAAEHTGIRLERCLRGSEAFDFPVHYVSSVREAASFLAETEGNVLVTTGSRELREFTAIPDFENRIFARVLSSSSVLAQCEQMGFDGRHLIAMQGPFQEEMNRALFHQTGARWLVTKESGAAGGFREKLEAAAACQVTPVVVKRPEEEGLSLHEICLLLDPYREERGKEETAGPEFLLAGIGMGDGRLMTGEVLEALTGSDALFGAARMIEAGKKAAGDALCGSCFPVYRPEEILAECVNHPDWKQVTVLYSGDTGFYSGASSMAEFLSVRGYGWRILPGISSVSYFASRIGRSWESADIRTAHGRELDAAAMMAEGSSRKFVLAGGRDRVREILKSLVSAGYGSCSVTVGENLSYPEERIRTGTAESLEDLSFESLAVILIERESV